ncbi:MAG: hydrolase [Pisciglobus halotolerans]|nr:hydrolase [Pisciglobus halotolerans]
MVPIVLLSLGFLGLVVAALTPRSTIGGAVSLASFTAYFVLSDMSEWYTILIFIAGILLLVLEGFIPSFGLVGIAGFGLILLGLYQSLGDFSLALRDASIALVLSFGLIVLLIRQGYSLTNLNKLVLKSDLTTERGFLTSKDQSSLLQQKGTTITFLRPAGKAEFDGVVYDVLSEGLQIDAGTEVEVVKVEGSKIIVRRVEMNG